MFFVPLGLWLGTPGLTVELYIWKGMLRIQAGQSGVNFMTELCLFAS